MSTSNSFIKEKQKRSYRRKSPVSQNNTSRKIKFNSVKSSDSLNINPDVCITSQSDDSKPKIFFKRKTQTNCHLNLAPNPVIPIQSKPIKDSSEEFELSYEIDNLFFNFLSEEEIEKLAVVEITDPK